MIKEIFILAFCILSPVLLLLSPIIAIIGELLYIPFIPITLVAYKYNSNFRKSVKEILNICGDTNTRCVIKILLIGTLLGFWLAIYCIAILTGTGTPFHSGH